MIKPRHIVMQGSQWTTLLMKDGLMRVLRTLQLPTRDDLLQIEQRLDQLIVHCEQLIDRQKHHERT